MQVREKEDTTAPYDGAYVGVWESALQPRGSGFSHLSGRQKRESSRRSEHLTIQHVVADPLRLKFRDLMTSLDLSWLSLFNRIRTRLSGRPSKPNARGKNSVWLLYMA